MPEQIEWKLWSFQQILDALPRSINVVKGYIGEFPEEHRQRNQAAAESLEKNKPTLAEMRDEARSSELITLGYALDYLATTIGKQWKIGQRLPLYQWAHELFRGGKPLQPTKPMRQVVNNAWRAILLDEMQQIQNGTTDAGLVLDQIRAFVVSAWGNIPSQLTQSINEMMLINLERIRAEREDDRMFHEQFVRNNIEAVLSMEVPTRLEKVQDRWRELGEYLAPAATRNAMRKSQRPRSLSAILDPAVWEKIKQALEQGDADALFRTLEQVEDTLEANLRLRLNARPEYREPASEVRYRGQPDRFFDKARALLLKNQAAALDEFRDMHFKRSDNPIIKEWYAYALSKFGKKTDIHEIIDLLEDAINLPDYRGDIGWTARWNLACALRQLPPRSDEALEYLLPVLENDTHTTDAFELCLLWALEQKRQDLLPELLIKSPYYEAHMLATRDAIEAQKVGKAGEENSLGDYYRRLNAILQNPDYAIPDAKEELRFAEVDKLLRHFTESLLIEAGIEWFRQRLSYGGERFNWKNWECLARLSERAGDMQSAWRCMRQQWNLTLRNAKITPEQKTPALRNLMNWAGRNGFEEDALRILRQNWKSTSLTEADVHLIELRWKKSSPGGEAAPAPSPVPAPTATEKAAPLPQLTLQEADGIVQRVGGLFQSVRSAEDLAQKSADAQSLIAATLVKDPSMDHASLAAIEAMRAVLRLAGIFHTGVDDQRAQEVSRQMREQLAPLQAARQSLPFYIAPLGQACERVIQFIAARTKDVPEIQISSLESLKVALDRPSAGETYQTRIFARLTNPGKEEMRDINLAFIPQSAGLHFEDASILIPLLGPQEKRIVEGVVNVSDGVEDRATIQIHVSYKSGGVIRAAQTVGHVPVRPIGQPIPYAERYVTGRPVVGRSDLFHGRSRELKELLDTFAGGRLLKLYFVNGIRRVGKSTLMEQLAGSCGPDILPLVLNLQDVVQEDSNPMQLVNQLIREAIEQVQSRTDLPPLSLVRPDRSAFEMDPPWVVFEAFLEDLRRQSGRRSVLLCLDELPYLVQLIANPNNSINDGFLAWMRSKVQKPSNILLICTGSALYANMRKDYEHNLWGNMEAYNVSFVDRAAMEKIATLPVKQDDVIWLPEALERLWDMTEGHPWIIQIVAENATRRLNIERRRLVGPGDVDRGVEEAMHDERTTSYWWNEHEGQVTETHRQIAFLLLQRQPGSRMGLPESELIDECQKGGIRLAGRYLDEMRNLEILTDVKQGDEQHWRIKGAFLERFLNTLMIRTLQDSTAKIIPTRDRSLALMLDWENVKISLLDILKKMPAAQSQALRPRLAGADLADRLLEAASRHGQPRQKWAIANWDLATFAGDQAALKRARYMPDLSGEQKDDASDHVLRERIHYVLREQPDIDTYIIGTGDADFGEVIKTLQEKGKRVVLWATKAAMSSNYKHHLKGPDSIQVEWLEDIVFGKEASV